MTNYGFICNCLSLCSLVEYWNTLRKPELYTTGRQSARMTESKRSAPRWPHGCQVFLFFFFFSLQVLIKCTFRTVLVRNYFLWYTELRAFSYGAGTPTIFQQWCELDPWRNSSFVISNVPLPHCWVVTRFLSEATLPMWYWIPLRSAVTPPKTASERCPERTKACHTCW